MAFVDKKEKRWRKTHRPVYRVAAQLKIVLKARAGHGRWSDFWIAEWRVNGRECSIDDSNGLSCIISFIFRRMTIILYTYLSWLLDFAKRFQISNSMKNKRMISLRAVKKFLWWWLDKFDKRRGKYQNISKKSYLTFPSFGTTTI